MTEIYSRDCDIKLQALKIDDNKEILNKAVIQSIAENSTTHNVKRMRDLILHRYDDERRVSLAIENKVCKESSLGFQMFCPFFKLSSQSKLER